MCVVSVILFINIAVIQLLQIPPTQCFLIKNSHEARITSVIPHNNETISSSILNNSAHEITKNKYDGQLGNNNLDIPNNGTTNSFIQHTNISHENVFNNFTAKIDNHTVMDGDNIDSQCRSCSCGKNNRRMKRIIGGVVAEQNDFPWIAGLYYYNNSEGDFYYFCGAMLITKQHLLTAAHCVNNTYFRLEQLKEIVAVMGIHENLVYEPNKTEMRRIDKIIEHPEYEDVNYPLILLKNDIAILKLEHPILFNTPHIQPVCLPKSDDRNYTGLISIASGWGRTTTDMSQNKTEKSYLHKVEIPIMSVEDCRKKYNNTRIKITDDMICGDTTGRKDACLGDSGGPLQISEVQRGIVEAIGIISAGVGCARPATPGVYTRIASYMHWVKDNIDGECLCTG